jgi:C4-dicarboxylate transporter DctQ subunit
LKILQRLEEGILVLTLTVMCLAAFAQVLNRNIFMRPITWFEELARYCMIYMTVFAAEIGLRDGTQIAVDAVVGKLKGKARQAVGTIATLFLLIFAGILFVNSIYLFQNQLQYGQLSPSMRIPMSIPYFSMVIGFGTICVTQCVIFIQKLVALFRESGTAEEGGAE